jgi:hypothetical protein
MPLVDQFKGELAMIKRAPLMFIVGFCVLATLIGCGEYQFFKATFESQRDQIETLKSELSAKRSDESSTHQPKANEAVPSTKKPQEDHSTVSHKPAPKASTGDATASGSNSIANTGNGAHINTNDKQ